MRILALVILIVLCKSSLGEMHFEQSTVTAAVLATPIANLFVLFSAFRKKGAWLHAKYQRKRLEEQALIDALKNPAPADSGQRSML